MIRHTKPAMTHTHTHKLFGRSSPRQAIRGIASRLALGLLFASLGMTGPTYLIRQHHPHHYTASAQSICGSWPDCPQATLTSGVRVRHDLHNRVGRVAVAATPTAEIWKITGHWLTEYGHPNCDTCEEVTASIDCQVDWTGVAPDFWEAICSNLAGSPFIRVRATDMSPDCNPKQPYAYRLHVEVAKSRMAVCPRGAAVAWFDRLEFVSQQLSKGRELPLSCNPLGPLLKPVYETYRTNSRGFLCGWQPDGNVPIPELSITYEEDE